MSLILARRRCLLAFLFLFPLLHMDAQPGGTGLLSREQVQEDFALFRRVLEERHPGIDRYRQPGEFAASLQAAEKQLNKPMSKAEFFTLLSEPIDVLDCGHTELQLPKADAKALVKTARLLPFRFGINEGHLFIRLSYAADTSLGLGYDVVRINGKSTDSLLQRWQHFYTSDGFNETMKDRGAEHSFREHYAYFVEQPDSFTLNLRDHENGAEKTVHVSSLIYPLLEKKYDSRYECGGEPKKLRMHYLDGETAIMTIETFQAKELRKNHVFFRHFVKKSLREMKKRQCKKLVIDLRDNTGGNVNLGIYLYRRIAAGPFRYIDSATVPTKKPMHFHRYTDKTFLFNLNFLAVKKRGGQYIYRMHHLTKTQEPARKVFHGDVYVLTNGQTFSNASNFAALVQYQRRGLIVGEEPGGAMNGCNGMAYIKLTLPNSKLIVRIPVAKVSYPFKPYTAYGHGVKPDFTIPDHPYETPAMGQYGFLAPLFCQGQHVCPVTGKH